ncbi:glutamate receptor 2.1-like [Cucurbita pepo subsp. pepo]|uniref:glutamate receptor 2.1-like n=1 Tax=Cucurbita pepo subsp. pepo TaxID=3664 RepID=UPI000C9D3E90|nr:glutamate receptor 2.1-like [Cucurbita pepo subsp. pepo]
MKPNHGSHRALWFIAACLLLVATAGEAQNVSVGVVLDMESWVGKMGLSCIDMSLSEFYEANPHYKTRVVLHRRDSAGDVVGAAAAALHLINNNKVEAILGPTTSMQTNFVIKLAHKAHVPILTFTASTPALASHRSPYFFRLTHTDSAQVAAISALLKAYNWREVVLIYQDDEFGDGMSPYLIHALQGVNARVPYQSIIDPTATEDHIGEELYKLMTMPTRVFVVHMLPSLAIRLFAKANEIGMMREGYVWILTDATANLLDSMTSSVLKSMEGALGVRTYVPKSMELERFKIKWKRKFIMENSVPNDPYLDIFGLWAYDAARALAMAVEKTGAKNFTFENPNGSENLTDLQTLGVSRNGEKIVEALSKTKFMGLTGNYEILNGQLQSTEFEIVNVNSNGGNRVGFWNTEKGLLSKDTVIWPGNTVAVPKGWEFPTGGKRLRIGVPVKKGYSEFMKLKGKEVEGYCKDVFDAAIEMLSYVVSVDYIPFAVSDGSSAGSYDELIMQVYKGVYDGAVGDITIVANRSKYVDFTLPFTDSGVSMVVPTKANSMNRAWLFLKPLTVGLWITSLCFLVFMGFVVWFLEHRINPAFRGPPSHQIGTSLWYSFCTMVFAQRETLISNLARLVVVIWFFVMFVLTQSYTASLTSLLTVQQLQPTITNINELLTKQSWVGYLDGSFVWGLLTSVGIKNLKSYRSPEELDKLLKLGGSNGGIDAAFDETPYIKLFLSKFPNKYITADPTYKTDGFGFAFPIGSLLVADISRAVLNVRESEKMNQLQMKWFGGDNSWSSVKVTSSRLNVSNFWGLFLIVGTAAIVSLFIYFFIFLRKELHTLRHTTTEGSNSSIRSKIRALLRIYDKRDLTSHTFRKSNPPQVVDNKIQANHGDSVGASSSSNYLLSPSNDSIHDTNHEFSKSGDLSPSNQAVEMVIHTTEEIVPQNEKYRSRF